MRLESEKRSGNKLWLRGFVLLLTLPIWFWLDSTIGAIILVIQLALSLIFIVRGIGRADTANGKLIAARERMALPEARIVQQSQPKARS